MHVAARQLHIAPGWVHFSTRQVYQLLSILSLFSIFLSVHRVDGVDAEGHVTTVTHSLVPDSITLVPGYDAMKEDQDIYKTTDFCGYSTPRHFPEMALPIPGVPAQQ